MCNGVKQEKRDLTFPQTRSFGQLVVREIHLASKHATVAGDTPIPAWLCIHSSYEGLMTRVWNDKRVDPNKAMLDPPLACFGDGQ